MYVCDLHLLPIKECVEL